MWIQRVRRQEIMRSWGEERFCCGGGGIKWEWGSQPQCWACAAPSAAAWPAGTAGRGAEVAAGAGWMEAGGLRAGQACAWQCKPDFVLGSGYFSSRCVSAVPVRKTWLAALPCNLFDHGNFFDRLPCDFLIYQIEFNNSLLLSPFISLLGFTYDCCLSYPFEALNLFSICEKLSSMSACIICKNMQQNCCYAWELINVNTEGNGRINQACLISGGIPIKFSGTGCQQDALQKDLFFLILILFPLLFWRWILSLASGSSDLWREEPQWQQNWTK